MGHCVKDDGGGGVDGEGVDRVAHGNGHEKVEKFAHAGGQAFALVSHKESESLMGKCGERQEGLGVRGGANGEDVVPLEKRKKGIHGWDAEDGNPKYAAHGGSCGSGMVRVRSTDCQNRRDSHGVGCAKQRAHVSGVHHFIQYKNFAFGS